MELKNLEQELGRFRARLWAAAGFVLACLVQGWHLVAA